MPDAVTDEARWHGQESNQSGKSTLVSRNIMVMGRRTSMRLEPEMWASLREIAKREGCKIHDICSLVQLRKNPGTSLTAAIRVFLMLYYRAAATQEGHNRAGHGNFDHMLQRAHITADMLRGLKGGIGEKIGKENEAGGGYRNQAARPILINLS